MSKIKIIFIGLITSLLFGTSFVCMLQNQSIKQLSVEVEMYANNVKAYQNQNSDLKEKNIQFQYTIEQLNYSKDSLDKKLNEARKQLKISDSKLQELALNQTIVEKIDTMYIELPSEENSKIDTLIQDKWSKLYLELEYPNKIITDVSFNNESIIVVSKDRETINPPKKCFIARWFQKKQDVIKVDVIENNPYATTKTQKFIKLIK